MITEEQLRLTYRSQLSGNPKTVLGFYSCGFKSFEYFASLRVIVDRENELSFQGLKNTVQFCEVFPREDPVSIIILAVIIRRIEIEEGFRPVEAGDHIFIGFVLDIDPRQAKMDRRKLFLYSEQAESRPGVWVKPICESFPGVFSEDPQGFCSSESP